MNGMQMAWRSVVRKPAKSILLLLLVSAISLLLLSGMACSDAGVATQDMARQAVGAGFLLEENEADRHTRIEALSKEIGEGKEGSAGGYYQKKLVTNGMISWQTGTDNSFETLLLEDIEKIAKVPGVKDYNITTAETAVNPVNFQRIEDADTDQTADLKGVSLIGTRDMTMEQQVLSGNLTIKEGRMVEKKDKDVCVISEELAEKNSLKVGDPLQFNDVRNRENAETFTAEIIGIYQIKQKMAPYMFGDTYRSENVIFTDLRFPEKADGKEGNPLFAKAYFKAADVDQYDALKEEIKKVDINWKRYDFIDNNGSIDTMSANFHDMESMSRILVWIVTGAGFVILFLVFLFWMKNRVREVGILLALGNSKFRILSQILTEALLVAVLAVILSFAVAPAISNTVADYMVKEQEEKAKEQEVLEENKIARPYEVTEQKVVGVKAGITWEIMLKDGLGVALLVTLSVLSAGIMILRRNPKDILSEMS